MTQAWKEFREFAVRGNALDLAVGVVIGAAFGQIVNSLVNDILNPILSIFTGHVDFSNLRFAFFGHLIRYGSFLNAAINFVIIAFAVFLIVKQFQRFQKRDPLEKECQFCRTYIPVKATRCPACTSQLT